MKMGLLELAQYTYGGLKRKGIRVTLSGGACVSIYSDNAYLSGDLDFIRELGGDFEKISRVMAELGFRREGRHFIHPASEFYVEFPAPPLMVGDERPKTVREYVFTSELGKQAVRMLSPTDCVKDRLCGFFHWKDKQSLDQAVQVAKAKEVDRKEIKRWAKQEGMEEKCREFLAALRTRKPRGR